MYRVGFGDFFLMSLPVANGEPLHILIDCGVHAVDLGSIEAAIEDMHTETNGKLALIVMTHRHADHISGFGIGQDVFKSFSVERVWMSWFENPADPAAVHFQATLEAVAMNLQLGLAARGEDADSDYMKMAGNAIGAPAALGGLTGNQLALDVLRHGFSNSPPIDYYQAGDAATLPDSLVQAGLSALILGPPIDPKLVSQMNGKGEQYLATTSASSPPPNQIGASYKVPAGAYPASAFDIWNAKEIVAKVGDSQPDLLAAQAQQADNTINNQSLVILFSFKGKTLLFAGDAQWGNWQNFLYDGALGTGAQTTLSSRAAGILGAIDFYKVGHHGSTNATPIDALKAMRTGCVAMCSTQPGAYGTIANKSEVPRIPLMQAIDQKTTDELARSDMVDPPGPIPPAILAKQKQFPAAGPLPNDFSAGPGDKLYVDCEL